MISVCMATYNGARFVGEQIKSIICQLDKDDELIISDDHSTDGTIDIIEAFRDDRIKVFLNDHQRGYTSNFYNALAKASGDIIFLSDQDDVWLPEKVETTKKYLDKYDFVHSDSFVVDEKLDVIFDSHNQEFHTKGGFINNLLKSRYLGCCMAFNRKVLSAIFPVPTRTDDYPHDLWIALISEKYFKSISINERLILYRRHGQNASNGGSSSNRNFFKKVLRRFYYLKYVLKQKNIIFGK